MKNKLRAILALSLGLSMVAGAQRTVAKKADSLLKQEQRQERIGKSTGESATLLAELVDEFARNGLAGTDVEILNGMQSRPRQNLGRTHAGDCDPVEGCADRRR